MRAHDQLYQGKVAKPAELMPYVMEKPGWRIAYILILLLDVRLLWVLPPSKSYLIPEVIARTFLWVGMVIFYYFIAVDPLPPGISKVRKFVESFIGAPEVAPASAHD